MTRIFHIATVADWDEARRQGRYTTSTRGRTLAEEGFIHASRGDQWQAVPISGDHGVGLPLGAAVGVTLVRSLRRRESAASG